MEIGGFIGLGSLAVGLLAFIRIFLMRQISDLRSDVDRLNRHVHEIEVRYDEERGQKHKARNDVARALMALELVHRLAQQCSCGVLAPLQEIIDRLFTELDIGSIPHRRFTDSA